MSRKEIQGFSLINGMVVLVGKIKLDDNHDHQFLLCQSQPPRTMTSMCFPKEREKDAIDWLVQECAVQCVFECRQIRHVLAQ